MAQSTREIIVNQKSLSVMGKYKSRFDLNHDWITCGDL